MYVLISVTHELLVAVDWYKPVNWSCCHVSTHI